MADEGGITTASTEDRRVARPNRRTARVIALLISLLFLLAVAEVGLRVVFPLGGIIYRLNDEYLHEHIPGSAKVFVHQPANGGHFIPNRINAHG